MNYTAKERQRYNEYRQSVCENLGITKNQYNWLRRKGEELRKVYENNCNGLYKTEEEYTNTENIIDDRITDYIKFISEKQLSLFWYYQTDPRGATIYLDKEPIPENNYTQAYCIY